MSIHDHGYVDNSEDSNDDQSLKSFVRLFVVFYIFEIDFYNAS